MFGRFKMPAHQETILEVGQFKTTSALEGEPEVKRGAYLVLKALTKFMVPGARSAHHRHELR